MTASSARPGRKLRFAILCHGTILPAWQAQCVRSILASGLAEPVLLLITTVDLAAERQRDRLSFNHLLYQLYDRHWVRPRLAALQAADLSDDLGQLPVITTGAGGSVGEGSLAAIAGHALDFILQLADGVRSDGIAGGARFGIWTFHRGSDRRYCALDAFWTMYRQAPVHNQSLLRLTEDGANLVVERGAFKLARSCARTIDTMLLGGAEWAARACRQIVAGQWDEAKLAPAAASTADRLPNNRQFLRFLAQRAAALARGAFRRIFLLEYWNVGIVDATIERVVADGKPVAVRWLGQPRPFHYYADPFALPEQPQAILFEEYSHITGLGWISTFPLTGERAAARPVDAFAQRTHRSYPFLFSAEGAIFCVPESAADRRVDLYQAIRFPGQWQHAATLIEDFPALDSSLFFHEGHWWLFCTRGEAGGEHKLHAWYASALRGPWQAHPLNPLKCDVTSSRPAGRPFLVDGVLYRPAQDCSRTYGGSIVVTRITTLTPTDFAETPAGRISPSVESGYGDGLHTVCPMGDKTIIDGKRFVFDLRAPYLRARRAVLSHMPNFVRAVAPPKAVAANQ